MTGKFCAVVASVLLIITVPVRLVALDDIYVAKALSPYFMKAECSLSKIKKLPRILCGTELIFPATPYSSARIYQYAHSARTTFISIANPAKKGL